MKKMTEKELFEFHSGFNEVELTDKLIKEIVENEKWKDEESLKELRSIGAKWNIKRNSLVMPTEFF
tara:strand:+ start:1280 stop:1477 length:198 start_codon:yes stop_codon:yes gene_type:complete